ncbi:chemotaxis protein CheA [Salipiger mangrovisoli]|uniref:Chemotaxis protein CheA n=1 Tax=Salipiger mangrovisoli TaxID=2865933 RepID=A0ABR9WYJ5_9RHOB|nr:chemotaxis protein CheA [Salipiger mangrovisoli]MBE9636320.1 chemotaxis protein CheA [Salipiger mangrovisoli]
MTEDAEQLFPIEARALAESLEAGLLDLKSHPEDRALIDGVFRDLHTLKGSGAMFGHTRLAQFLHDFETAFEAVRDGRLRVSPALVELGLRACDHAMALLDGGSAEPGEVLLSALAALTLEPGAAQAAAQPDDLAAGTGVGDSLALGREAAAVPDQDGPPPWSLSVYLAGDTLTLGGRPLGVLDELRALGAQRLHPLLDRLPPLSELTPDRLYVGWRMELPGELSEEVIREAFLFHDEGLDLELERRAAGPAEAAAARGATAAADPEQPDAERRPKGSAGAMMRVPAERLDEMMDRVGELVIAEARLAELAARSGDTLLITVAEEIQRLATSMRETTMSIRMTPIGSISGRFRRLVHDLDATLGKPIDLVIEGQDTELDKTVIEMLADPLMHLIRNSADHGLETPEERRSMGKPDVGTIRMGARYSGAEVVITLADDGRGLDLGKLRAHAEKRGLIGPEDDLDDAEIRALILQPGFSTAQSVTELSGRGVGMDVVRRTIEQLRGTLEVESEPGHGTQISMRLPLTLAIIDGLLVEVAGERYTIPLAAVEHIIELPEDRAQETGHTRLLTIRDKLVPFLRLRQLLDSPGAPGPHQKVVVVTAGELRVGLTVDRIIGSSQTVIKQLSPLHAALKSFSGATVLGDGTVALILDVPQLVAFGQALDAVEAA